MLGWNVMPTARNARGIDIVAYSRDSSSYRGIQVKALSKRSPVPLGKTIDKVIGDYWVIVNQLTSKPTAYVLTPKEVIERAHRGEKEGRVTFWLQPNDYEHESFHEAWNRIGHG